MRPSESRHIFILSFLTFFTIICGAPATLLAGGGPENVLLVVNPTSPDSLAIANTYTALRNIPPHNVVYIPWPEKEILTKIDPFREKILIPVLKSIQTLRRENQIDYVVYSAGFPHRIDIGPDVTRYLNAEKKKHAEKGGGKTPDWPKVLTKVGSLNGLTYLWQWVRDKNASYASLSANRYFRKTNWSKQTHPTLAFRGAFRFDENGNRVTEDGPSYFLSTLLGYTQGRGNTRQEVLDYLASAASADGTRPQGTIYYVRNNNVRSKTRHNAFQDAVAKLRKLDVDAEIIEGTIPKDRPNVQGLMAGCAYFDWGKSGSTILPGAICEHLTSWGGGLHPKCPQTPLTAFLRYGAAGSSGTVFEPYAVQAKFPTPMVQVHYARGCTLAEAFYQSVAGPYQLLIVGDPLCRPWANIPAVEVKGLGENETIKGTLQVHASATFADDTKVAGFEMFIDGRRVGVAGAEGKLQFDTTTLPDGYHELRIVAFEPEPVCSQGRKIIPFHTANHGRTISISIEPENRVSESDRITIEAQSPKATSIGIFQNTRPVGRINGESGKAEIEAKTLGAGPVRLDFIGLGKDGPKGNVLAEPVFLEVEEDGGKGTGD